MGQRQRGYSLAELLAVIIILGVVAAVAVPEMSTSDPDRLNLAVGEFARAVRYARSEAIRSGRPHGVSVDPANKRMRVFRADMSTDPPTPVYDVYHPVSKKLYDIDLTQHPFARVDAITGDAKYQGTCKKVYYALFDAHGTPWCAHPPTVAYRQAALKLALGAYSRTLVLDGVTGRVTLQ